MVQEAAHVRDVNLKWELAVSGPVAAPRPQRVFL